MSRAAEPSGRPGEGLRVFVTRAVPEDAPARIAAALPGARIDTNPHDRTLTPGELRERAAGSDALICTLADRIDRPLLDALSPRLRVVANFAVGHENVDLDAARALGVRVTNTPDVLTDATAEVAVALALACSRRVVEGDRLTREGRFHGWKPTGFLGRGLTGAAVGIVGAGRIGRRAAEMFHRGFDCRILVHSRTRRPEWEDALGARFVGRSELLAGSDVVSLHCPLTPETRHWIDAAALAAMKPSAVLVNTARGAVVDEAALVEALRAGRPAAAGLDVYEREPALAPGLVDLPRAVLLPHVGSATREARSGMGRLCADAVVAVLRGEEPPNAIA